MIRGGGSRFARPINNKLKLIRSMLAAGIVQDTFAGGAGEREGGEEEISGGYLYY